jgi:hypothetical protein
MVSTRDHWYTFGKVGKTATSQLRSPVDFGLRQIPGEMQLHRPMERRPLEVFAIWPVVHKDQT